MSTREQRIHRLIERSAADPRTGEVLWRVVSPATSDEPGLDVVNGDLDRPFFIASVSKLFTVVCLAQLRDEGRLDWDAPLAGYLPDLDLSGLAVDKGRDVSHEITVREVMAHTAGLADYFEVLEAQQELFPAENSLARAQLGQLVSVVQVYRALGGGWRAVS